MVLFLQPWKYYYVFKNRIFSQSRYRLKVKAQTPPICPLPPQQPTPHIRVSHSHWTADQKTRSHWQHIYWHLDFDNSSSQNCGK